MESKSKITEKLEEGLKNVKDQLSKLRKRGIDTKIMQLKTIRIPAKIRIAETSESKEDIKTVIDMLNSIKKEIDEAGRQKSIVEKDLAKKAWEEYKKEVKRLEMEEKEKAAAKTGASGQGLADKGAGAENQGQNKLSSLKTVAVAAGILMIVIPILKKINSKATGAAIINLNKGAVTATGPLIIACILAILIAYRIKKTRKKG